MALDLGTTFPQGTDENVKVSQNDESAGFLLQKLSAGSNITLTVQRPYVGFHLTAHGPQGYRFEVLGTEARAAAGAKDEAETSWLGVRGFPRVDEQDESLLRWAIPELIVGYQYICKFRLVKL